MEDHFVVIELNFMMKENSFCKLSSSSSFSSLEIKKRLISDESLSDIVTV
jgi:hypothetical protein